jgi:hypothetical protein
VKTACPLQWTRRFCILPLALRLTLSAGFEQAEYEDWPLNKNQALASYSTTKTIDVSADTERNVLHYDQSRKEEPIHL